MFLCYFVCEVCSTDKYCLISIFAPILKLLVQIALKFSVKCSKKKKKKIKFVTLWCHCWYQQTVKLTKYFDTINDLVDTPSQTTISCLIDAPLALSSLSLDTPL